MVRGLQPKNKALYMIIDLILKNKPDKVSIIFVRYFINYGKGLSIFLKELTFSYKEVI